MTMMTYTIRAYDDTDRAQVNAVALAAFAQYAGAYDDWDAFSAGIARTADLARDGDLIVAARSNDNANDIAGAIVHLGPGRPRNAIYPDDWSVLRMLVVDPNRRGQGIARRLVAAALAHARDGGAPTVGLHTSPIMETALRLYESIGFERELELAPIRGVPYARYVLPAGGIGNAIRLLGGA